MNWTEAQHGRTCPERTGYPQTQGVLYRAYRDKHGLTASETMDLFDRFGVLGFLENPTLQWQRIEDTVLDVEEYISVRS